MKDASEKRRLANLSQINSPSRSCDVTGQRMLLPNRPQPRAILPVEVRIVQDRPKTVACKDPHQKWIQDITFTNAELLKSPRIDCVKEGIVGDQLAESAMDATESHKG